MRALNAIVHLPQAAARELIAHVDLRRHEESRRRRAAGAVGVAVMRRVEVVAELVRRNQGGHGRRVRALGKTDRRISLTDRPHVGDANRAAVEIASGHQMRHAQ